MYVYPNRSDDVLVCDGDGRMRKTGFALPRWIVNNAFKLIRSESSAKESQLASDRKKQEERLNTLSSELRALKKDVACIRGDVAGIAAYFRQQRGPIKTERAAGIVE